MIPIIKRGTTPCLEIKIKDFTDFDILDHVDFLIKQHLDEEDLQQVMKTWPVDVELEDGIFYVPLSEHDTRVFNQSSVIKLDVRPVTKNGHILATKIKEYYAYPTGYGPEV